MQAPTIETARLSLGAHRIEDLDAMAAMWADPAVHAMIGGGPRSREEVWIRLLRSIGQWSAFGYGQWVLRDRASGGFVGEIGLIEARRAMVPPLDAPEAGWALSASAHGRGLAREALAAILEWSDAAGIGRTLCIIDPANAPSIRLAERTGYRLRDAKRRYRDRPVGLWERGGPATGQARATALAT